MFWYRMVDVCTKTMYILRALNNFYKISGNRYRQNEANKLSQWKYLYNKIVSVGDFYPFLLNS